MVEVDAFCPPPHVQAIASCVAIPTHFIVLIFIVAFFDKHSGTIESVVTLWTVEVIIDRFNFLTPRIILHDLKNIFTLQKEAELCSFEFEEALHSAYQDLIGKLIQGL